MCNCENMTTNLRDRNMAQFFQTVFSNYEDESGQVSYDKLEEILSSLGRQLSLERIAHRFVFNRLKPLSRRSTIVVL